MRHLKDIFADAHNMLVGELILDSLIKVSEKQTQSNKMDDMPSGNTR
jgi:hypothetical protein